ncbi:baseplate J/gp47 family protein [Petrachloros mirabilis]
MSIPLVMGPQGPIPTAPATLRQTLVDGVAATNPDYTANLPGSLIEDIASTDTGALVTIDQARVDAVNSITPYGANAFILAQLGAQFGIPQGQPTNTSVYVVFTGLAGYVIPAGFIVSDGSHEYIVQDGAIIATGGTTSPVYCVASQSGSWAVPSNTVTTVVTSVPSGYTLTVTNPSAGVSGIGAESVQSYRSRVLQAGKVAGQGTPGFITTLLQAVPGVIPRLVNILQVGGGWEVICGGGDPYAVANAIYQGTLDLSTILGSATTSRNITATITDPPNTYNVVFVNPPQQVVTLTATWNTTLANFTAGQQINQLAAPALTNYVNGVTVGQPMNLLAMTAIFQNAVASIIESQYLTTLTFSVYVNGVLTPPNAGTSAIAGDPESYFYCSPTGATVVQG